MKKIALTGIKPTGTLHIGNYFGAIKPALALASGYDARYFIADYHALNQVKDAAALRSQILHIAAGWLAAGLDSERVIFYRQSDVSETFELATLLASFTPKGLMNRAHAYKAAVDRNRGKNACLANGLDQSSLDAGINMGLFTYPILMAADILLFEPDVVPVGQDQTQHVEMAADIAGALNATYHKELLKIPQAFVQKTQAVIPGLDGRKMSKSYGNTIPLFGDEKSLRKLIMRMVTNSQGLDEPKNPDESGIFTLYKLFATADEQKALASRYRAGGMGWGEAKEELFRVVNRELAPLRERYAALSAEPAKLERILAEGAEKARAVARVTMRRLRSAVGIDENGK